MDVEKPVSLNVLRECAICGLLTDQPVVVCPTDGSALITHKPDELIGKTVADSFEILSVIGAGGMGTVYKAKHREVDRTVAIKFLHIEKTNKPATVRRFQQEAKAVAKLSHAHIVSFFHYGLTEDNRPFLVMDYVDGISVEDLLQQGPIAYERCLPLFIQACDALQHAHERGIIHRDIKPSNLMLVKHADGKEQIKILDFGVAKLVPRADAVEPQQTLTQTGELFGSPQYMSPEQWAGQTLDARSDMYALGCVMYEMLMGIPAVKGANIVATIHKHTNERPRSFAEIQPSLPIPQQLERVIFKAIEKEPDSRFPSMSVLKRNLEFVPQFAADEVETASRSGATQALPNSKKTPQATKNNSANELESKTQDSTRTNKEKRGQAARSPLMFSVASALGVATVLAIVLGTQLDSAWFAQWRLPIYEQIHGMQSEKLVPTLDMLTKQDMDAGRKASAIANAKRTMAILETSQPASPALASTASRMFNTVRDAAPEQAQQFLNTALSTWIGIAERNRKDGRSNLNIDGSDCIDEQILKLAHDLTPAAKAQEAEREAAVSYARDLVLNNKLKEAQLILQPVIASQSQLSKAQQLSVSDALAKVAEQQAQLGDDNSAVATYRKAIEMKSAAIGDKNESVAELQLRTGLMLCQLKQLDQAEEILLDALANSEAASGGHSEQAARILETLAKLYTDKNAPVQAAEMLKLAAQMKVGVNSKPTP